MNIERSDFLAKIEFERNAAKLEVLITLITHIQNHPDMTLNEFCHQLEHIEENTRLLHYAENIEPNMATGFLTP